MPEPDKRFLILAENPLEQIWANLSMWESVSVARQSIRERAERAGHVLQSDTLEAKAIGLSYCLRNARDNLKNSGDSFTSKAISNYYGCMWFASAILVADYANDIDLRRLERFTKFGHGLGNIVDEGSAFPNNEYIFVKQSGFFYQYLVHTSLDKSGANAICLPSARATNFSEVPEAERGLLTNLFELLARIPEIQDGFEYITGARALIFKAHHMTRNMSENSEDMKKRDPSMMFKGPSRTRDYTWIGIATGDTPEDFVRSYGPQLEDVQLCTEMRGTDMESRVWGGKVRHDPGDMWYRHMRLYRSAMAPTCWINPLFGAIHDPIAIHLMLSYQISIMARYRPAIWREILEGDYDAYRALISIYNQSLARILTQIVIENISGRRMHIVTPGSFNAPI